MKTPFALTLTLMLGTTHLQCAQTNDPAIAAVVKHQKKVLQTLATRRANLDQLLNRMHQEQRRILLTENNIIKYRDQKKECEDLYTLLPSKIEHLDNLAKRQLKQWNIHIAREHKAEQSVNRLRNNIAALKNHLGLEKAPDQQELGAKIKLDLENHFKQKQDALAQQAAVDKQAREELAKKVQEALAKQTASSSWVYLFTAK